MDCLQAASESEVQTAGNPVPVESSYDSGYFDKYPGNCPARIGKFRIIECRSLDGGYLYLQAQGAITDDSGIVYLPADAESEWRTTERLTPLGGPWWSWTLPLLNRQQVSPRNRAQLRGGRRHSRGSLASGTSQLTVGSRSYASSSLKATSATAWFRCGSPGSRSFSLDLKSRRSRPRTVRLQTPVACSGGGE